MDKYHIVAQDRYTKQRIPITSPMTFEEAKNYKPSRSEKIAYRYFRVAKVKSKKKV
jgi:hypothetical protein